MFTFPSHATKTHKYKDSNTFEKELLDQLLYEDLHLLKSFGILNAEMINDLAFYAQVSPKYILELMKAHDKEAQDGTTGKPV